MRHHAKNIALFVHNSRDVVQRSVRIGFACDVAVLIGVTKHDLAVAFDALQGFLICEEVAVAMADRNME